MTRRILGLAAIQFAAALAITEALPRSRAAGPNTAALLAFTAAFALAGFLPVHLEFGRGSYAVVLDEAVLVVALFALDPAALVLTAVAGDFLSRVLARQTPVKATYNLGSWFLAASASAAVFAAGGRHDAADPAAWLGALAAMTVLSGVSLLSISIVLALVEQRRLLDVVVDSVGAQLAVTGANVSIGLAVVALFDVSPVGPLVLAPVVGMVAIASRRHALQAAERLRFERLYAAAARTGELAGFDEALAVLATEARVLVTGSVAMCCAARGGEWVGVRVDDTGTYAADPATVDILAGLANAGQTRTVTMAELPVEARRTLPAGADLVVAAPAPPARADVVLAVFREIAPDGQGDGRHEVLGAFAGHAALVVANALLFEEVDAALHRELDMNRQKSEFVAAVSHELRTPLTTVMGAVSTMQRLGDRLEPTTQQKLLTRALDQGERLRRLIDELLLVAAAEHSGLQADLALTDIGQVIQDAAAGLARGGDGRVRLELEPCDPVVTDAEKIRRIVTNLMENALKYAPTGPITVRLEGDDRRVALSVSDTGPGIPPADRRRVFEPFVQLDQSSTRRQGGTGLGLHLCSQLAELLDGRLDLDETPGGGSRFTLTLPGAGRTAVPALKGAA